MHYDNFVRIYSQIEASKKNSTSVEPNAERETQERKRPRGEVLIAETKRTKHKADKMNVQHGGIILLLMSVPFTVAEE